MFFLKRKRSVPLAELNYLDLVPVRKVESELAPDSGRIVVMVPRYDGPLLGRFLQPRLSPAKRYIRVTLDARGTFLWPLIDGCHTVADLAVAYEAAFPTDCDEVPLRISLYLQAMYDNKFISYLNNAL